MPIQYEIDHERRLVRARVSGVLTDDDIFAYQRAAWSRPDVAGYDEMVDMSAVVRIALPSVQRMKDLARLSSEMDARGRPSRFIIVAPGDIAYIMARLYKGLRGLAGGNKRVGVFAGRPAKEQRGGPQPLEFRPKVGGGPSDDPPVRRPTGSPAETVPAAT